MVDLAKRRERRVLPILASGFLVLLVMALGATSYASARALSTSTYELYAGHGVGVLATYDLATGCSEVYLSSNLVKWHNVTPPLARVAGTPKGQCLYQWISAYFVSPSDGWLMARNQGSTTTLLRHTLNGGQTWVIEPGSNTGSNAGQESISFVNAALGWRQQFGFGSNGDYSLARTLNGGVTWSTRSSDPRGSCVFANDLFVTPNVGFASVSWAPATNESHLWRTRDGGVTWSLFTLPRPSSVSSRALGLYGKPVFSKLDGAVPVDYSDGIHQAIYFYVTHDGGTTWSLDTKRPRVVVYGSIRIDRRVASEQPCLADAAPVASGHVVDIASANWTTWWIVQPDDKGRASISIVSLTSGRVSRRSVAPVPTTPTGSFPLAQNQTVFTALSSTRALTTLAIPYGYQSTYETSDGGATWKKVNLPGSTSRDPRS